MKKKILIFIIALIVLFVAALTIYIKFIKNENKASSTILNIEEEKKKNDSADNDKEKYKDFIITSFVYSYPYDLIVGEKGMTGDVYINSKKELYISEDKNNSSYKISDEKFKTLYKSIDSEGVLLLYAISESGNLYNIFLNNLDIKNTITNKLDLKFLATNFVNLKFKTLYGKSFSNLMVLAQDNNIYEITTGTRYDSNIVSLNEEFYAFGDNTIANSYGNMIKDLTGKYLKIKYYVQLEKNSIFGEALSFVITEDNRIIYNEDKNGFLYTYMYNKKIKKINYDIENSSAKIKIVFDDNSKLNVTGYFTDYYGFK